MEDRTENKESRLYILALLVCGIGFLLFFSIYVMPPLIKKPDIIGAFAAGFVNPFATGYSVDVIMCWVVLAIWVLHERMKFGVKYGWIALVLGVIPGVATGFSLYLLIRMKNARSV